MVWCPAVRPPVFVCRTAETSAALRPVISGDCIPSAPHLRAPPAAAQVYTPPAHTPAVRQRVVPKCDATSAALHRLTWSRSRTENTTRPLSSPEKSFIPLALQVRDVTEPLWKPVTSKRRSCNGNKQLCWSCGEPVAYSNDGPAYLFVPTGKQRHQLEDCDLTRSCSNRNQVIETAEQLYSRDGVTFSLLDTHMWKLLFLNHTILLLDSLKQDFYHHEPEGTGLTTQMLWFKLKTQLVKVSSLSLGQKKKKKNYSRWPPHTKNTYNSVLQLHSILSQYL